MTEPKPGKITISGWPDPNDWFNRLYQQLAGRYEKYTEEEDVLLRRNKAGAMLGDVVSALMEFPPFKSDSVHMPLKDLLIFLADLDKGRDHPWTQVVGVGGTNISTTAKAELKSWVRVLYKLLIQNNFSPVEAYQHIASVLTNTGRTGRDRSEPVRWRLVQGWCREEGSNRDLIIQKRLDGWWEDWQRQVTGTAPDRASPQEIEARDKALAAQIVTVCLDLPHLRDRFFSGVSD